MPLDVVDLSPLLELGLDIGGFTETPTWATSVLGQVDPSLNFWNALRNAGVETGPAPSGGVTLMPEWAQVQEILAPIPPEDLRDWAYDTDTKQLVNTKDPTAPKPAWYEGVVKQLPTFGAIALAGLGGTALASLVAGSPSFRPPTLEGPTPTTTVGQRALTTALNEPLTTLAPGVTYIPPGSTEALPIGAPGVPSPTGAIDLQRLLRAGLAGQRTLAEEGAISAGREAIASAEEGPAQRAIRLAALAQLPGYFTPTGAAAEDRLLAPVRAGIDTALPVAGPLTDQIQASLVNEIARAFAGEYPNPLLDRQIREGRTALRAQLSRQLAVREGDVELTTTGSQAMRDYDTRAEELKQTERRNVLNTFIPLEDTRRRFNLEYPNASRVRELSLLFPEERARTGRVEDLRQRGLAERVALAGMGRGGTPQVATTLSSMVPISPLLGIASTEQDRSLANALRIQTALQSFGAEREEAQRLAQGIAGTLGGAAGWAFGLPGLRA